MAKHVTDGVFDAYVGTFKKLMPYVCCLVALSACRTPPGGTEGGGDTGRIAAPAACSTASTCQMRVYCDPIENCRCLKSAEGEIRCGLPPSCSIKKCTTSADCAELGAGYFCDSPKSSCCGDDEQRCIPPCRSAPCPAERICSGKCCLAGETCVSKACAPKGGGMLPSGPIDGVWTGFVGNPGPDSIGLRFAIKEQSGRLSGQTWVEDTVRKAFLIDAEFTGSRNGASATWTTETGLIIRGTFRADGFDGTLQYPSEGNLESFVSVLTLRRGP